MTSSDISQPYHETGETGGNGRQRHWKRPFPVYRKVLPELIIPNPKLKLMDQVREVLRLRHYSIRTERSYCDAVRADRPVRVPVVLTSEEVKQVISRINGVPQSARSKSCLGTAMSPPR